MKTTVRLDDPLLDRAKREAARRGVTLTSLIEQGLKLVLAQSRSRQHRERIVLPKCGASGGVLPGVDLKTMEGLR